LKPGLKARRELEKTNNVNDGINTQTEMLLTTAKKALFSFKKYMVDILRLELLDLNTVSIPDMLNNMEAQPLVI